MGRILKNTVAMVIALFLLLFGITHAKNEYFMDTQLDCGYIGLQDIDRDQIVLVHGRNEGSTSTSQSGCTLNFQTKDTDATVRVEFTKFLITDCSVKLYLSGSGSGALTVTAVRNEFEASLHHIVVQTDMYTLQTDYGCGDRPETFQAIARTVTVTLHKGNNNADGYSFTMKLTAIRDDRYPPPSDSNPIGVGLVIGIAGAVFGIIIIVTCVGICCFRKYRTGRPIKVPFVYHDSSKSRLDESSRSNTVSVGYTNETMRGSPGSKKKLLAPSDSSDEKTDHFRSNMKRNQGKSNIPPPAPPPAPPPPPGPDMALRNGLEPDRKKDERNGDVNGGSRNNMLNALHSHSKFRHSFKENERDAEERAKRISSTSSFEKLGNAPDPPSSQENLSCPSLPSVPKSPKGKKSKHAAIHRNPRPSSMSSEELNQIEKARLAGSKEKEQDRSFSSDEVRSKNEPKGKTNTTHSLKPDRKGPKGRKKKTQSVSSALDPEPQNGYPASRGNTDRPPDGRSGPRNQRDRFLDVNRDEPFEKMGSGRYSKRSNGRKSPRPGKNSGRGFCHRRGRSMDHLDSRPTTPTSMYGSVEDLEYLPPLQRASSKTSLYSSRSSLYDRRRRRKGSNSGSVVSYIRDDMSVGRHSRGYDEDFSTDEEDFDGYEKPLSRRDRSRMYRSENDLGRRVKEISTQTLRETATQTGPNESVVVENKRLVKKKKRAESVSSSGTQTAAKKKKNKTKSTERLDEIGKDSKSKVEKTKRSKSVPDFMSTEDEEKPKPKPKPKPRKSVSADTHLDEPKISASQENLAGPYYPQSEGFVPQPYPGQNYPMVAPPAYGQQPGMPMAYPGYTPQGHPIQGVPPGYPVQGVPHGVPQGQGMPTGQQMQGVPPGGYVGQGVPQGYQMPQQGAPQSQNPPAPRKPRKSNWEMLCEMTDGEYKRDDVTETGSIASSVFTNNPASMQGYGMAYQNQPGYNPNPQFYPPPQSNTNQQQPPPQRNYSGSVDSAHNVTQPLDYENADFHAANPPAKYENKVKDPQTKNYRNESIV